MAISIYLDTQDFVKMYRSSEFGTSEILNYLCEKVDSGEIEIAFSAWIVSELITYSSHEYREDRIARIELVNRLSRGKAYLFPTKIRSNDRVISPEGDWLPDIDVLVKLKEGIISGLQEKFGEFFNVLKNNGEITDMTRTLLRQSITPGINQLADFTEFPLPPLLKSSNIFMEWVIGDVPDEDIVNEVRKFYTDLKLFRSIWFDYSGKNNYLHDLLKDAARGIIAAISSLERFVSEVENIQKVIKKSFKNSKFPLSKQAGEDLEKLERYRNLDVGELKKLLLEKTPDIFKTFPEYSFPIILAYIKGRIQIGGKIKDGDYGDVLHAIYLPFVDLWRCDKACGSILITGGSPYQDRIVSDLFDLPSAIEKKLKSATNNIPQNRRP